MGNIQRLNAALLWVPRAVVATAISASAVWAGVRDAIGTLVHNGLSLMAYPLIGASIAAFCLLYIFAVFWTGRESKGAQLVSEQICVYWRGKPIPDIGRALFVMLRISNRGAQPAAIEFSSWTVSLKRKLGKGEPLRVLAGVSASLDYGAGKISLTKETEIVSVATTPIQPGAIVNGWIAATLSEQQQVALEKCRRLNITFCDAFGAKSSMIVKLNNGENLDGQVYHPLVSGGANEK